MSQEPLGFFLMASPEELRRVNWFCLSQVKAPGKVPQAGAASVSAKISGKGPVSAPPEKTGPTAAQAKAGRPEDTESSSEDDSDSEEEEEPIDVSTPQVKSGWDITA